MLPRLEKSIIACSQFALVTAARRNKSRNRASEIQKRVVMDL